MSTGIVAVDELARAYQAARSGEFRNGRRHHAADPSPRRDLVATRWTPSSSEQVVLVAASHAAAGASTLSVALATNARDARIVECCTVAASGLAAASSAELGPTSDGWVRGSRDGVLIERRGDRVASPEALPAPGVATAPVTILDCSWDLDLLGASAGWLGELARSLPCVAVVARPTVPGMRRLEAAIAVLGETRVHAVVMGLEKRWPRHVEQSMGIAARRLRAEGRLTGLPTDPKLATDGLTPDPLPAPIVASSSDLLTTLLKGQR